MKIFKYKKIILLLSSILVFGIGVLSVKNEKIANFEPFITLNSYYISQDDTYYNANPLAINNSAKYRKEIEKYQKQAKKCISSNEVESERCVNNLMRDLSAKKGARVALDVIEPLAEAHPFLLSYSHDLSHTIGDFAVKYFEDNQGFSEGVVKPAEGFSEEELKLIDSLGKALVDCDGWGAFGCYHGVIEVGLGKLPAKDRTRVVQKACMENPAIQSKQYFINQCLHWFGHGMAIFTDQSLNETLAICDSLSPTFGSDEVQLCLSGTFHAGSVPGTSDVDYLSNVNKLYNKDDVYFPCLEIPEKFVGQCFSHVPGRTGSQDTKVVFSNCENIPEKDPKKKRNYIHRCYDSGANLLLVNSNHDPKVVVESCQRDAKKEFRKYCYGGAVRYSILRDPLLSNTVPFEICKLAEVENKSSCYIALGAANNENYFDAKILIEFCQKGEAEYVEDCLKKDIPD
ncbi:hypothetical protein KBB41_00875 [Candidatus Curtissbacteria bacterium]|nr:hypothetical protein [Candidatus Curtissbacteria bacterium]